MRVMILVGRIQSVVSGRIQYFGDDSVVLYVLCCYDHVLLGF